ncbi:MAG: 30S ribosomal protein S11 [Leptospiraceae bacterium]|nr:30S ribosomal protein S11 [Leptospiraceae bacterium]MCB1202060.1 30S ribosomal protein S11 [Leptospiraceae bacterium]
MSDKKTSKKEKLKAPRGKAFINATFNNTIITFTDVSGNTLSWASGGSMEFKGSRKATPYAAQLAAKSALDKAKERGLNEVEIYVRGPGVGRESAIRAIATSGLKVTLIKDTTPVPHNGCRPRKKRRV